MADSQGLLTTAASAPENPARTIDFTHLPSPPRGINVAQLEAQLDARAHTGDCSRFRHPGAAWPDDTLRSASPLPLKDNTPHPHECGTRWRHTTVTELPPASRWKPPLEASYTFGGSYLVQLPPPGVQRGKVSACMGSCSIYRVKCPPVHRSWTGPLQHEPRLDHWQCRRMN